MFFRCPPGAPVSSRRPDSRTVRLIGRRCEWNIRMEGGETHGESLKTGFWTQTHSPGKTEVVPPRIRWNRAISPEWEVSIKHSLYTPTQSWDNSSENTCAGRLCADCWINNKKFCLLLLNSALLKKFHSILFILKSSGSPVLLKTLDSAHLAFTKLLLKAYSKLKVCSYSIHTNI